MQSELLDKTQIGSNRANEATLPASLKRSQTLQHCPSQATEKNILPKVIEVDTIAC